MNDLISVIIPVYNVEQYLPDCLDSVLASTYCHLEIILINDGSKDNSGKICDEYAAKDKRIVVIHQDNQGVSAARNAGLAVAKGKYIGFVDSDDIISPVMFETLWNAITVTDSDIAACEYTRDQTTLIRELDLSTDPLRLINGRDNSIAVLFDSPSTRNITWTGPMLWNKLYRTEKISSVFDKKHVPAEDIYFNWDYCLNCSQMVIVPKAFYYWNTTPKSITQTMSVEKFISRANAILDICSNTLNAEVFLQEYLNYAVASSGHIALWHIFGEGKELQYVEFVDEARHMVSLYYRELITHADTTLKTKIFYMLCRYCFPIWKLAARSYRLRKKVHN